MGWSAAFQRHDYLRKKKFNGFALISREVWTLVGGSDPPIPSRGDITALDGAILTKHHLTMLSFVNLVTLK